MAAGGTCGSRHPANHATLATPLPLSSRPERSGVDLQCALRLSQILPRVRPRMNHPLESGPYPQPDFARGGYGTRLSNKINAAGSTNPLIWTITYLTHKEVGAIINHAIPSPIGDHLFLVRSLVGDCRSYFCRRKDGAAMEKQTGGKYDSRSISPSYSVNHSYNRSHRYGWHRILVGISSPNIAGCNRKATAHSIDYSCTNSDPSRPAGFANTTTP